MTAFVPTSTTKKRTFWRKKQPCFALLAADAFPLEQQQHLGAGAVQASSSFLVVADGSSVPTTTLPSGAVFEPVVPDPTALLAFGSIILLSAVAVWVWANQVVPVSRTNLALSKKRGPVKDYLDELRAAAGETTAPVTTSAAAATNATETEKDVVVVGVDDEKDDTTLVATSTTQQQSDSRALERWLFTDWLEKDSSSNKKPGRQKEPAVPVLKNAKWNSGDNPVLVASALIMAGVFFTAVTERVAQVVF